MSNIYDKWDLLNSEVEKNNISSQNFVTSVPITKEKNIRQIDNFLPEELYERLFQRMSMQTFKGGWLSSEKTDPHGHWSCNFVHWDYGHNLMNMNDFINDKIVEEVWNWVKENVPEFKNKILIRTYMNAHTYGIEGYYHTDSNRENEKTMVLYILNEPWDKNWGGETSFVDDEDNIIKSVLPKKNRVVIFDSNISHVARSVSRLYNGIRKTFMFKVRERRSDNFEKLSKFLAKNNAFTHQHQRGSLHDHLVRTYQLLEDKGAPVNVCFAAGIHSIFGTNIFKNNLLTLKDKDVIVSEFSEETFELAALFSIIDRPDTLETPVGFEDGKHHLKLTDGRIVAVDQTMLDNLRLIEGANLTDQDDLNEDKYPVIYNFYNKYDQNA